MQRRKRVSGFSRTERGAVAGSTLRKKTAQDIPEQTVRSVCRVKASSGTLCVQSGWYRGVTASSPMATLWGGVFLFCNAQFAMRNAQSRETAQ